MPKNKPWWTELLKILYVIPAFFLGGFIILVGGALAEAQDIHDSYLGRFILFTIVGGIAWYLWDVITNPKHKDNDN
jgi:hypothetical protein